VSVHQDPGVAAGPIRVVPHDRLVLVAPGGDVRDAVRKRESERPSHATGRGGSSMVNVKT